MGVADNYVNDIRDFTYGEDLRKPIHDGLELLLNYGGSERPVVVLSKNEYDAMTGHDSKTFYAIKKENQPDPPVPPTPAQEHYGLKINKTNSDTSARIEYLYDAIGFTPAHMDCSNSKFEYGSWSNAFFVRNNYPVMLKTDGTEDYRLDPDDHSKKLDGTASDIADLTYDGNAFSCFDCHIWMKFYEDENYQYIEVANYKLDNSFVDYPYHRGDGSIPDKLYYPMYPGYVDSDDKLRSISGVAANMPSRLSEAVARAKNNGSIWSIKSWSYHLWFHVLLLLISKNFNSQASFGTGYVPGGGSASPIENGTLNANGQFFGYNNTSNSIKTFYCENAWGDARAPFLGMYNVNGNYKIKMTPPYTCDGTSSDYQTIDDFSIPIGNWGSYIKDLSFDNSYGFVPKTIGGSSNMYVGDCFYATNNYSVIVPVIGGGRTYSASSGVGSWTFELAYDVGATPSGSMASLYLE